MERLKNNFVNYLPLNRKDRSYTGTKIPHLNRILFGKEL